jgi:hypothetical protein
MLIYKKGLTAVIIVRRKGKMNKLIILQFAALLIISGILVPIAPATIEAPESKPELVTMLGPNPHDLDQLLGPAPSETSRTHSDATSARYEDMMTIDPLTNETIDELGEKDPSYETKVREESATSLPDMNGTEINSCLGFTLFGNASVASYDPKRSAILPSDIVGKGDIGIEAYDPNRPPAPPLDVAKEGHWFPNMAYSRIRYEVLLHYMGVPFPYYMWYPFYIHIDRDEDIYTRIFRVYFDGSMIFEAVIGSSGFDGNINVFTFFGYHKIELEIKWGYYSDHGWKLVSFKPGYGDVTGEFFPFTDYGRLRWDVFMGPDTKAEVKIENVDDPYVRILRFFVDGVQVGSDTYAPCDITFDLGNYATNSSHEIMLQVHWCYYKEWGYKLSKFRVHYEAVYGEIDYMDGHRPHDDVISYIQDYYKDHGYARFTFVIDDQVPHDDQVTMAEYNNNYYNVYFDHRGQAGAWKYVLFGHHTPLAGVCGWTDQVGGNRIFVADQTCDDYAYDWWNRWFGGVTETQVEKLVLMHEGGHSINILEVDAHGDEVYCSNSFCVMSTVNWDSCDDHPYYCTFHWEQRSFP